MKSCRETLAILLLFAFSIFPSSAQTICDEVAPQVLEFISAGVSFIYAMTPIDQPLATVQNYSLSLSTTTCGLDYYFGASDEESEGPFHFDPSSIIFQGFLGTGDSLPSLTLTSSLMGKNAYISFVTRAWCCQDVCDVTISRMRACTTLSDPCTASDGGLCLNPGEEVDISGDPTIIGDLDTFQGSTLVVGSATVIVNGNANIRGTIEITRCTSGTHTALRATGSLNVTGIVKMKCTKCRIPSISVRILFSNVGTFSHFNPKESGNNWQYSTSHYWRNTRYMRIIN